MLGYLTSPETVQLVPWLRRQNIHVPPTFSQADNVLDLGVIKQYAQNVECAEWDALAAHMRGVGAQHGWRVTDACPAEVVEVPAEETEVIEVPDAEEPEQKTPKRRRRVIKVKKVKK